MLFSRALALFLLATAALAAEPKSKPNVLFLAVDDWNDWVGCFGENQGVSPNIDRLAARGVSFTNAHTSAVYCAPSRTSLMTGRNPHSIGCYHDQPHFAPGQHPEIKDLAMWFRENGYHTAGGGKIYHHMPGFIDQRGWVEYFHWSEHGKAKAWHLDSWGEGAPLPEIPASATAKFLYEKAVAKAAEKGAKGPKPKKLNSHMEWAVLPDEWEEKMADTICANWAAQWLRDYEGEAPFFLGFGLYAPHKPNFVPQRYFKEHPLAEVEQPRMHPGDLQDLPPNLQKRAQGRKQHIHDVVTELKEGKKNVRGYLAACTYADVMLGRVLDALEESGQAENTIVVLWSDNGYHLGEKGAWAKHTLWERTSNVPLIWAGPGVAKGSKVDATVSLLDVYPTLLELGGLPANAEVEGESLAGILADPDTAKDRTVLQGDGDQFALINRDWRYIRTKGGEEQLYDLRKDPGEHENLAAKPEFAKQVKDFAAQLPTELAEPGLRPQDRDRMRLVIEGEKYRWELREKN